MKLRLIAAAFSLAWGPLIAGKGVNRNDHARPFLESLRPYVLDASRQVGAKDRGKTGLVQALLGNGDHGIVEFVGCPICHDPVHCEKVQSAEKAGPLVTINERLILRDVEGIGSRDLEKIGIAVKKFVRGLRECLLERVFITDAAGAAEFLERSFVDGIDDFPGQEDRLVHWASFCRTFR